MKRMFDDTLRELRQMGDKLTFSVEIPTDEDGYVDRLCPSELCSAQFKVRDEDWGDKVRDEEVFCPFCRHGAASTEWNTQEQVEHLKQLAIAQLQGRIMGALKRDARRWNQHQNRGGLLQITLNVDAGPTPVLLPPEAAAAMRLKVTCAACGCRYAAIGAAFFCPACGHNSVEQTFTQSIAAILRGLDALGNVRAAIADRDTAETTVRRLLESSLQDLVTAFQRYSEARYICQSSGVHARRNAFQNLDEGDALWCAVTGHRYRDYVEARELATLSRMFQQRHLLSHTQGIVDERYLAQSCDSTYKIGQRIVVRELDVRAAAAIIEKLARGMASDGVRESSIASGDRTPS